VRSVSLLILLALAIRAKISLVCDLAHAHEGVIRPPIAQPDVRHLPVAADHLLQRRGLPLADEHAPARVHPARGAPARRRELGSGDSVRAEVAPRERLRHDPRRGGEHQAPPPARREHAPRGRVHVDRVEPGQHSACRRLDVRHARPRGGREDQHPHPRGGRRQAGQRGRQRRQQQQEREARRPARLEGDERVVREGAPRPEQRALEVRRDRRAGPQARRVALVHRRERRLPAAPRHRSHCSIALDYLAAWGGVL
jgi:hypothetical protein